jgi:hypothetical protein
MTSHYQQAIELAEAALARRLHPCKVRALVREAFGIKGRSCDRVLARARGRIRERTGKGKEHHAADAFAFYDSVVRDEEAPLRLRLLAQQRIDELMGLEAAQKHEHSGPGRAPMAFGPDRTDHLDEVLRDYLRRKGQ